MAPSTTQCAGVASVAAFHRGEFNVTPETGSLINDAGMAVPTTAAVQSISEIVLPIMISGATALRSRGDCISDACAPPLRRTQSAAVIVRRMRAVMRKSKALWPQPEALLPRAARRNALQFLVQPFVREIHRVGDADHGLECNETAVREVGIGPGQRYAGRGRSRRRWGRGGLSLAATLSAATTAAGIGRVR